MLLLCDLAGRARFLRVHYTDEGVLPLDVLTPSASSWTFSLYWLDGSFAFTATMFGIAAIFALMLLVGWRTRLATVASWALLLSLHYRNIPLCSAGDLIFRLLLFWAMFLPLGACASVDSRRRAVIKNPDDDVEGDSAKEKNAEQRGAQERRAEELDAEEQGGGATVLLSAATVALLAQIVFG